MSESQICHAHLCLDNLVDLCSNGHHFWLLKDMLVVLQCLPIKEKPPESFFQLEGHD